MTDDAMTGLDILVVGDRCWGRGKTVEEALAKARKEGGAAGVRSYAVFLAAADSHVDEVNGGIFHPSGLRPAVIMRHVPKPAKRKARPCPRPST